MKGVKEDQETRENQNMGHGSGSNTVPRRARAARKDSCTGHPCIPVVIPQVPAP